MAVERKIYPVEGMSCASCAMTVEKTIKNQPGVEDAGVNFANSTVWVTFDPKAVKPEDLRDSVRSAGYDLIVDAVDVVKVGEEAKQKYADELKLRFWMSAAFSVPLLVLGMFFMDWKLTPWLSAIMAAPVVFWFGRQFFTNGWKQARHFRANMDTLVALSTSIAYLFSLFNTIYPEYWTSRGLQGHIYYESASIIVAFILLGKWLEEKAKNQTTSSIKKIMGLQPDMAWLVEGESLSEVPLSRIRKGDVVLVKPGSRVPVDGRVVDGQSVVDESTISGESIPVVKKVGDKAWAGTMNQRGSFKLIAEQVGSESVLGRIIATVESAQNSKAPVQHLVDKVAGIFVPAVMLVALLTLITWLVLDPANGFSHGLISMVTVLAIACPCALGLATPTAIIVGVGRAAEKNILIRDAESLETAHQVNYIVLDKTGTLSEGVPSVDRIEWFTHETTYPGILKFIEQNSGHPLADAIVRHFETDDSSGFVADSYESIAGKGVKTTVKGKKYLVGNPDFLRQEGVMFTDTIESSLSEILNNAGSVVGFAENNLLLCLIRVSDRIKPSSREAIKRLKARNIEVAMLTGDNRANAEFMARELEIAHYAGQQLPSDKADFIKTLKKQGKVVAMVGDGVNDSEALSVADVGIAMGKGSDIAIDVAQVTILNSDLNMLVTLLDISGKTIRTIRQNLFWAFIYNIIGIPIAAGLLYPFYGITLDPMFAGMAMALSSVSVVTNSLRLRTAWI